MPTAFVTGATGFIGQHLVCQLVERGWRVRVFRREGSAPGKLEGLEVEHRFGDVTDAGAFRAACDEPFDALYHVAADTSVWRRRRDQQTRVNVGGTENALAAARAAGVQRFLHTSSIAVYGFHDQPITEDTPWDREAYWINYCRTKAEAETRVREAADDGLDAVILNPAHVMGPWDKQNWIRLIRMTAADKLPGIPPGSGSFADVREVARAHVEAATAGRRGENYLLGGEHADFATLVGLIAAELGVEVHARPVPAAVLKAMGWLKQALSMLTGREPDITPEAAAIVCADETCSSAKASAELGYRETPLKTLVADTVAWLKAEKLL